MRILNFKLHTHCVVGIFHARVQQCRRILAVRTHRSGTVVPLHERLLAGVACERGGASIVIPRFSPMNSS